MHFYSYGSLGWIQRELTEDETSAITPFFTRKLLPEGPGRCLLKVSHPQVVVSYIHKKWQNDDKNQETVHPRGEACSHQLPRLIMTSLALSAAARHLMLPSKCRITTRTRTLSTESYLPHCISVDPCFYLNDIVPFYILLIEVQRCKGDWE